jgi:hypothetical protein
LPANSRILATITIPVILNQRVVGDTLTSPGDVKYVQGTSSTSYNLSARLNNAKTFVVN